MTAKGELRLCLFGNTGVSLRPLLKDASQKKELLNLILTQLRFKKESHYLELGDTGATPHLASIGIDLKLKIVTKEDLKDWTKELFEEKSYNMIDVSDKKLRLEEL